MTRIGRLSFESTICAPPTAIPLAVFAEQMRDAD